ncbi:hypothetical protein BC831DRAFT_496865 [Entophlyctis helioformis]|nr:hypothetical protein BC831DRAFT_496865 [Entophlyctis helioformis]
MFHTKFFFVLAEHLVVSPLLSGPILIITINHLLFRRSLILIQLYKNYIVFLFWLTR